MGFSNYDAANMLETARGATLSELLRGFI